MSEKDAADYSSAVTSEGVRLVRIMLENHRIQFRDVSTHEVKTAEVMSRCEDFKADRINIEKLAKKLGLSKVYDLLYRFPSLEVHGKMFGLPSQSEEEGIRGVLSFIVSLATAIALIADNRVLRNRTTTANEIIHVLRLDRVAGK